MGNSKGLEVFMIKRRKCHQGIFWGNEFQRRQISAVNIIGGIAQEAMSSCESCMRLSGLES